MLQPSTVARCLSSLQACAGRSESDPKIATMTCQYCQTWILDDDHRCRRCGRRVRNTPSRVSPSTFPIAASALAHDIFSDAAEEESPAVARVEPDGQQVLFPGAARDV